MDGELFCVNDVKRLEMLAPPSGEIHMVLDTDAFNEEDDQYAIAYALRASQLGKLSLDAIYAAPYSHPEIGVFPDEGVRESYREILNVIGKMGEERKDGFVFMGSDRFIKDGPVISPASEDLVNKAMKHSKDNPLYVVAIGAPTNVASAILRCPEIVENIVIVWLGGTPHDHPSANEYNLEQDVLASKVLFDSDVPLVQLPTESVISHLTTTLPELERHLDKKTPIGTYLTELLRKRYGSGNVWSKVIWDISAVAYLLHPEWFSSSIVHAPLLTRDIEVPETFSVLDCYKKPRERLRWAANPSGKLMRIVTGVDRDSIFRELFSFLGE